MSEGMNNAAEGCGRFVGIDGCLFIVILFVLLLLFL